MGDGQKAAVVFGARRLGRGIAAHLQQRGFAVTAVARSVATIESLAAEHPDVNGLVADLGDPGAAAAVLARAAKAGGLDLVVNAIVDSEVSAAALSREQEEGAQLESLIGTAIGPVHLTVDATVARLREQGRGCFIQITGGLALRAQPGTAALAATGYATRALIEGSLVEAREDGVHLALLVIRGLIESDLTAEALRGKPLDASMTDADVNAAVELLYQQQRAWTHELVLTPPATLWQG